MRFGFRLVSVWFPIWWKLKNLVSLFGFRLVSK